MKESGRACAASAAGLRLVWLARNGQAARSHMKESRGKRGSIFTGAVQLSESEITMEYWSMVGGWDFIGILSYEFTILDDNAKNGDKR